MTREDFARDMTETLEKMKSIFYEEYWNECCCLKSDEEKKIQNAIRKIHNVLEGMNNE